MYKNKKHKRKKKHHNYKTQNNKNKIQIISYDDPKVRKELEIKVYQKYLQDNCNDDEGGGTSWIEI